MATLCKRCPVLIITSLPIAQLLSVHVSSPVVLNSVASSSVQLTPPFIASCAIVLFLDLVLPSSPFVVSLHHTLQGPHGPQLPQVQFTIGGSVVGSGKIVGSGSGPKYQTQVKPSPGYCEVKITIKDKKDDLAVKVFSRSLT